jgi:hypothetical protein
MSGPFFIASARGEGCHSLHQSIKGQDLNSVRPVCGGKYLVLAKGLPRSGLRLQVPIFAVSSLRMGIMANLAPD